MTSRLAAMAEPLTVSWPPASNATNAGRGAGRRDLDAGRGARDRHLVEGDEAVLDIDAGTEGVGVDAHVVGGSHRPAVDVQRRAVAGVADNRALQPHMAVSDVDAGLVAGVGVLDAQVTQPHLAGQ